MYASVEISLYPLAEVEYKQQIWDFIANLRRIDGLEVLVNGMSTQVFGDYDLVVSTVMAEVKKVHEQLESSVFLLKFINADRSLTSTERKPNAVKYTG